MTRRFLLPLQVVALITVVVVTGCTAQQAAAPTYTPYPTYTPFPTATAVPTETPTPTATPTATLTPTNTPTATPTPAPTDTATPVPTDTATPAPTNTLAPTNTAAPTNTPAPTTPPQPTATIDLSAELNVAKQCGHFEYKVTELRRVKAVYFYDESYVAQGEFLLVFVEVKNISSGTSYFATSDPAVVLLDPAGNRAASLIGSPKGSGYAQWMYQKGDFYEDINPGGVLGLVEAYDVPVDQDYILAFGMEQCVDSNDDITILGRWSQVPKGHPEDIGG